MIAIGYGQTGVLFEGKMLYGIPGYVGWLYATREGDIMSCHFKMKRHRWKFMKPSTNKHGYFAITVGRKSVRAHRLVAQACIPNPRGLPFVNHKDSDRKNNRVENLEWCTASMNTKHAWDNGRIKLPRKTPVRRK